MIDKLTQEQTAKFPQYVAEWTGHGLSTKPADRPRAESAIRTMYAQAGLAEPKIIWCDSPLSGALTVQVFKNNQSVGASVWASVGGQHEAHWLSFYRFFHTEAGLISQTEKLSGLWELCQSAGWAYPYEGVCFICERHNVCKVNDAGLIHCENGPAIAYPDGFEIYAFNGVRLPKDWVENRDTIDPSEILKAQDIEQRAAGAALVGWDRMLGHLKHEVVDRGPNADWGDLLRVWMPGLDEPALMLKAECPRNGTICEFVPYEGRALDGRTYPVNTVISAQASRVFKHPETYTHPKRRT